jgi:TRAP transporter 4TM/12TM fusion protein
MPPILGSAAFILAQLIGVPYLRVVQAAVIPALLYCLAVFIMVDLEAGKNGLKGLEKDKIPNVRSIMRSNGHQLIPVAVLIYILAVMKATPMRAALWAILSVVVVSLFRAETVMGPKRICEALNKGARDALSMVASCATAGIVIGVLNLTGTGLKFAGAVVALARGNLPAALGLTMVASIILGMGLPTTAAYLITAAVAAPALVRMGVSPLAAHMFVFFFACISAITPPVALAAYAAANLAGANPTEVGLTATMLGSTAFIVPYMFVFGEELLWSGTVTGILQTIATSCIGVVALSVAVEGWAVGRSFPLVPRMLLLAAALGLIDSGLLTDVVGLVLIVAAVVLVRLGGRAFKSA